MSSIWRLVVLTVRFILVFNNFMRRNTDGDGVNWDSVSDNCAHALHVCDVLRQYKC